jgi:transposase InsO family protein
MADEVTAMDIKMLVATLPDDANVAEWCRRLGISRQTAYKWRRRFGKEGPGGLRDRSRAPKEPHGRSDPAVEDLVVRIRKQLGEQGLDHGPASVRDRLAGEHGVVVADATVWRILVRRGQVNPQPKKRPRSSWQRFQRDRPNECWQGDDTHYFLADGREVRVINMVDDHSRLNVDSLAAANCHSADIWQCFSRAAARHGIPGEFLNDNGRAWISASEFAPVVFQHNLAQSGVHQIHSSPYHPQTCGKAERFHQTQRRWLNARPPARTVAVLQDLLDEFRVVYNEQRPHRGIGRRTPAAVWAAQPPATPPHSAIDGPPTFASCRVGYSGSIHPGNRLRITLGVEWAEEQVTVIRRGDHATVIATTSGEVIRQLTLEPGRDHYGNGRPRGGNPAKRAQRRKDV